MKVILDLTPKQAGYLADIVQNWIDGLPDAMEAVQKDPSITSPEDYLRAVEGMYEMNGDACDIIEQLRKVSNV